MRLSIASDTRELEIVVDQWMAGFDGWSADRHTYQREIVGMFSATTKQNMPEVRLFPVGPIGQPL